VVWLLIAAGIISAFLGEWVDGIAILAIVILNAVIGFYQEYNAGYYFNEINDSQDNQDPEENHQKPPESESHSPSIIPMHIASLHSLHSLAQNKYLKP
jgi:magnesium-transporting ATPase (P-type)